MLASPTLTENPLRDGLRLERTGEPCSVVIFGASGDLAKRKLIPALFRLVQQRFLPAEFSIVGLSRTPMSHDEYRARMKSAVEEFSETKGVDGEVWDSFAAGIFYLPSDIGDAESYRKLGTILDEIDRERGTQGNRLFYLSIA
ncbi:MAG TPA: hypothetical protein VM943_11155, partial [Pyrinomonadaceae bacterium]|nr:hypothetical protein [Pyrinomonadaceae bacterium]